MILNIAILCIAPPQMTCIARFLRGARSGAVGVSAANKAELEGIDARFGLQFEAVFEYVAQHVALREGL